MLRAFKIRLYPNKEQEQSINKLLGCYRFVYNHMLALKQKNMTIIKLIFQQMNFQNIFMENCVKMKSIFG